MEGKNLEAVKNTADNFKSILPMVTGLVSLEIRNGFLIQAMSRRIHKLIQNRKRLRKYFNHMVLMDLPLKILNQILHL